MTTALKVDGLSKRYKLGLTHAGSVRELANRALASLLRGRAAAPAPLAHNAANGSTDKDHFWALKDVSFEVRQGQVIGIIGKNGAGKSTLLKLLSRITQPTSGRAEIHGRVASLLEVGTGFHPELTGRENVYLNGTILGMTKAEVRRQFDAIVDFAGVERFVDTPVKRYSSGMMVRLGFAVAAHLEPEILIVDEVLAVGDAEFQKKCMGRMSQVGRDGRTVLFVSHSISSVRSLCDSAVFLRQGRCEFVGGVEDALATYLSSDRAHLGPGQYVAAPQDRDRPGFRCVSIHQDDNHQPTGTVRHDQPFVIRMECRIPKEQQHGATIGLSVRTSQQQPIFTSFRKLDAKELPANDERLVIEMTVEERYLMPGQRGITVGLSDINWSTIDYQEFICPFEVVDGGEVHERTMGEVHGFVFPRGGWRINTS